MGLFEKIFTKNPVPKGREKGYWELLNGYVPAFFSWGGNLYESELVRSAIDIRAQHMSKLDFQIIGSARPGLQSKLKLAPNEFQTWSQFFARVSTILDVKNTAFLVPVIDEFGETTGITPIYTNEFALVNFNDQPFVRFKFDNGKMAAIELDRVGIIVRQQLKNDLFGESNAALDSTMELINIQNQGIQEAVKSAASFRFMATASNFMSDDDLVKERTRFTSNNLAKSGGFLLWPSTYKDIKQIESKPFIVDAEQTKLIQTNVYNYYGVSEAILQNKANEAEMASFFDGAIEPFCIQLSQVITKMLFTKREREVGNRIEITADRLQYMSTASKVAMVKELSSIGAIKVDEIRKLFNYAPIGGDAGEFMPVRGEYYGLTEEVGTEGGTSND